MKIKEFEYPIIALILSALGVSYLLNLDRSVVIEISPTITIERKQTTILGEEVVVTFSEPVSMNIAKHAFKITPYVEGTFSWVSKYNELHFLPLEGFTPATLYTVEMDTSNALLAYPSTHNNVLQFVSVLPVSTPRPTPVMTVPPSMVGNITNSPIPVLNPKESQVKPVQRTSDIPSVGKYIDINLTAMTVTLFRNGVSVATYPLGGKGNPSTSPTREGTFTIKTKEENHYSTLAHVYMPLAMQYSGNYFLHSWPYWPSGTRLQSKYSGGCVRFFEEDAQKIFDFAEIGTIVNVYST